MNNELLKDYEADVQEALNDVKEAEKEIESAKDWHYKMLLKFGDRIKILNNFKKKYE